MSCEQRENGTFRFKQTGYTQIMRSIREMFRAMDNYHYEVAVCIYEVLKENKVKKNGDDSYNFIRENIGNDRYKTYHQEYMSIFKTHSVKNAYGFEIDHECINVALDEIFRNKNNTRLKPRRSAYPKLTNKDKGFQKEFNELIWITLSDKDKTVDWSVREGNRTVNEANGHYITSIFFKLLRDYKWKIGEGGETVCVSESFNDDPCSPDSDSETTRCYQKLSQKQIASKKKMQKALLKSGYYG